MTDQPTYPRIILPEGYIERNDELVYKAKGWFPALVEIENGNRYTLTFYDPVRLGQDLNFNTEQGEPWLAELNVIVVTDVTLKAVQQCIEGLWHKHKSFFDDLKPDEASR